MLYYRAGLGAAGNRLFSAVKGLRDTVELRGSGCTVSTSPKSNHVNKFVPPENRYEDLYTLDAVGRENVRNNDLLLVENLIWLVLSWRISSTCSAVSADRSSAPPRDCFQNLTFLDIWSFSILKSIVICSVIHWSKKYNSKDNGNEVHFQ